MVLSGTVEARGSGKARAHLYPLLWPPPAFAYELAQVCRSESDQLPWERKLPRPSAESGDEGTVNGQGQGSSAESKGDDDGTVNGQGQGDRAGLHPSLF